MVKRLENWPLLLSAYLRERQKTPFEWGKNDCLCFVSAGVAAVTGYNFQDEYLPYNDEGTALELLDLCGGVVGIITKSLGHAGTNKVLTGQRGDVVLFIAPEGETAGIIDDSGRYFCIVTANGLRRFPLKAANRVWSY